MKSRPKIDPQKGIEKFFREIEDFMCRVNRKLKEREKEVEERYARGTRRTPYQ